MRIGLATTAGAEDDDLPLLADACRGAGLLVDCPAWDDPQVDWSSFGTVVVRSTWDYAARRQAFLSWADHVAETATIENPPAVLAWTTDKRYLGELRDAGIPVVPTAFVEPGDAWTLPAAELVVKPAVSAGSRDTVRHRAGDRGGADAHIRALTAAGRTVMIQPYQAAIDRGGERALVWIDGNFSHALTKGPLLRLGAPPLPDDQLYAVEEMSAAEPSAAELDVAGQVMAFLDRRFGTLLYARVDLVDDDTGRPQVLEVELAEPSLFHVCVPTSAHRFAAAIRQRVDGSQPDRRATRDLAGSPRL